MVSYFGYPFVGDVRERARTNHTVADEEHVCLVFRDCRLIKLLVYFDLKIVKHPFIKLNVFDIVTFILFNW